ncbi:hypothetical protein [Actinoallomurus sp. CA-142502]|uniref:hypothetical protein n=1 Tax=Actinoallomurus sp. CA-142502 TaxID=3239885 RepID=UPI003D91CE89
MTPTTFNSDLVDTLLGLTTVVAEQGDVKAAVEANHDDNQWWPGYVADWRVRMAVAGWSTRVSYAMVDTYANVVKTADAHGWDALIGMDDSELASLIRPLGLAEARIRYLRSLQAFLSEPDAAGGDVLTMPATQLITNFAARVDGASFKVAQCAALYARGYHCGIMPVDSGMVTRLAPCLGLTLDRGPAAHERMRCLLENCVTADPTPYRDLIDSYGYRVTIPGHAAPSWWLHLVLIYFKRLYLNRPVSARLCPLRPVCPHVLDCDHLRRE